MEGGLEALTGKIEERELEEEMRSSYLDYAMSVIVGRALPDARDGMKPVHRRILYSMYENGFTPDKPTAKCADRRRRDGQLPSSRRHGALRQAWCAWRQDFEPALSAGRRRRATSAVSTATRRPPMRYTEARLAPLATELLRRHQQGNRGLRAQLRRVAAGAGGAARRACRTCWSTGRGASRSAWRRNIPPHNLREVSARAVALIDDPSIDIEELIDHVKGPDFPTAG